MALRAADTAVAAFGPAAVDSPAAPGRVVGSRPAVAGPRSAQSHVLADSPAAAFRDRAAVDSPAAGPASREGHRPDCRGRSVGDTGPGRAAVDSSAAPGRC